MKSSDTARVDRQFSDNLPIYNLKAVVQETGLKPDTLRAWERRYGLPEPKRTESGHRLYSQYDIDTLKWLNARLDEGLNISRAVALWQELISNGQNPLQTVAEPAEQEAPPLNGSPAPAQQRQAPTNDLPLDGTLVSGDQVSELRRAWIGACLAFDEQTAEETLSQAFAILPFEAVCIQIIQRGLAEIGEGWQSRRVTVQQEHFASALTIRRLHTLLNAAPSPTRSGNILIACPPEEEHTFSPILLALLLRRRGWRVLYLGANVPVGDLEATIARARPTLVILIAQQLHTAATLLEMSQALTLQNLPLAYAGRIFVHEPSLRSRIPGHFLGDSFEHAVELIDQLMASPRLRRADQEALPQHVQARRAFRARAPQIEASAWDTLQAAKIDQSAVTAALKMMEHTVAAALAFGSASYLANNITWIRQYLSTHQEMSAKQIDLFFESYLHAVQAHLPAQGELVVQWLQLQTEQVL